MDVVIERVTEEDRSVLEQLMELYAYDFSEFDGADVNTHGLYGYRYLGHYWTEPDRHPFFVRVAGKLAGFVLVSGFCYLQKGADIRSISEFFILRKYRRQGIGRQVAFQIFDMLPGKWEVVQMGTNAPSKLFWEEVVAAYAGGRYEKHGVTTEEWDGQALLFDNAPSDQSRVQNRDSA
ncbi:MAG: GNAT family N-acetyltransferase [Anaerolineae bacterium]|nr:GNAT family N-acetyltransferase [Anaerolineae bacterium]